MFAAAIEPLAQRENFKVLITIRSVSTINNIHSVNSGAEFAYTAQYTAAGDCKTPFKSSLPS